MTVEEYKRIIKELDQSDYHVVEHGSSKTIYTRSKRGRILRCYISNTKAGIYIVVCQLIHKEGANNVFYDYCSHRKREINRYFANYLMEEYL